VSPISGVRSRTHQQMSLFLRIERALVGFLPFYAFVRVGSPSVPDSEHDVSYLVLKDEACHSAQAASSRPLSRFRAS
jgi:hypothetical protein